VRQYKKSKSSSKLSSVPAANKIYRRPKEYMSQRKRESPERSSRGQSRGRVNNESHSEEVRSEPKTFEARTSARKE
jgi:hypothetical protein